MAAQAPCQLCQRNYDMPEGSVGNASSSFFLSVNDQLELKKIKERSFRSNLRAFLFVKRSIKNYAVNSAGDLQQILEHGRSSDVVRDEADEGSSLFSGLLSRYNWTTTDPTDDPKFAARYMGEKTIIRTMPDRYANINDLVWVIKRAHYNKTGLNAFFLHKKHLVWVCISAPPDRSAYQQRVADRDVGVLTTQLQNLFFFRKNFEKINQLMIGTGSINYFTYPNAGARRTPLVLTVTGPACSLCDKAFPIPKSALLNDVDDDANQYYLTVGDLAALTTIKHRSFKDGVMLLGFLTRITSNLSSNRELAGRIDQGNVREVTEPVSGLVRVVQDRVEAVKRVFTEPIVSFGRAVTYLLSSDIDDLTSYHNGESVLFRTMPDMAANIRHVAWLIEKAQEQQSEMNAFFLHKRHFLWVKVAQPPQRWDTLDHIRTRNLVRFVAKDLRRNFSLRKETIPAINKRLVGIASVAYHRYPDRTWVDSVTDAVADNKVMGLKAGGVLSLLGWYIYPAADQAPPGSDDSPPADHEQNDGVEGFWDGRFGRHQQADGTICRPPETQRSFPVPLPIPIWPSPPPAPRALPAPP